MAIGYNRVDLIGNLGKDPQVNDGGKGTLRVSFPLAVDRARSDRSTERREEADWFPVIAWGRVAETCRQSLRKGSWVLISGQLQARRWQDDKGQWHNITEVIAREVMVLDGQEEEKHECAPF